MQASTKEITKTALDEFKRLRNEYRTEVKKESSTIKKLAATLVDNQFPPNERVIKGVEGSYQSWKKHYQDYKVNGGFAEKDLSEFITFGLTNREFQEFLEAIPYKTKNAWSEFVQSIRNILGLPVKANTALSAFLQSASDVVETGAQTTRTGTPDTELIDNVDFANKSIDENSKEGLELKLRDLETQLYNAERIEADGRGRVSDFDKIL